MSDQEYNKSHHTGSLYGAFAFGSVVLSCFAEFILINHIPGPAWKIGLTFALGMTYAAGGVLGGYCTEGRGPLAHFIYFALQCALLTALLFVSPIRGFFGIIVLPLVAQAIFDLRLAQRRAGRGCIFSPSTSRSSPLHRAGPPAGKPPSVTAPDLPSPLSSRSSPSGRSITRSARRSCATRSRPPMKNCKTYAAQAEDLATTRERNRVAREIHDGVGHYLTVVKTQLDAAAAILPAQPDKAREAVVKAARLTGEALDDVRRSVGTLRTDAARLPLPEALRALTAESELPVTVRLEGAARPLPPGIEHALFRSAQEGLTNVRKHATATAAEVLLDFRAPGRVTLAVTDNGHGANGGPATGFGLRGIAERIEVLGGRVESGNRAAGGFALTVEVPA